MKIYLIGIGCGDMGTMTHDAAEKIRQADIIYGARRLVEGLPEELACKCTAAYKPKAIAALLRKMAADEKARPDKMAADENAQPDRMAADENARPDKKVAVILSGDSGFYSGAKLLTEEIRKINAAEQEDLYEIEILPGISSLQYFASKIQRPWQDMRLVSAHGQDCDVVWEVMQGQDVFFLTGGKVTPSVIAEELCRAGLGNLDMIIGENLSYEDEKMIYGTAEELRGGTYAPLSVVLTEATPTCDCAPYGIPDDEFERGNVPMTKMEVRAVTVGKMRLEPTDIVWDIGAGTGSLSVEFAHRARRVYAVERLPEACELIRRNREKFCAWNLEVISGMAPEALSSLPTPSKVFIGGNRGNLEAVIETVFSVNPQADICLNAITLETLQEAMRVLDLHGRSPEISQISVSRAESVGSLHMMKAQNPVYVICG